MLFLSSANGLLTSTITGAMENGKLCSARMPKIEASEVDSLSQNGPSFSRRNIKVDNEADIMG